MSHQVKEYHKLYIDAVELFADIMREGGLPAIFIISRSVINNVVDDYSKRAHGFDLAYVAKKNDDIYYGFSTSLDFGKIVTVMDYLKERKYDYKLIFMPDPFDEIHLIIDEERESPVKLDANEILINVDNVQISLEDIDALNEIIRRKYGKE